MTVRSSRGRRRAAALVLAALVTGTSACSGHGGAAAVVDGEPIGSEEVQTAAEQLAPYLDGATPASILMVLVAEPTVQRVAGEHGVAVSRQEAERLLAQSAAQSGGAAEFGEAALSVARFSLLQRELGELPDADRVQSDILDRLEGLDVEVNPRYGELDFSRGGIVPVEHPWLVPDTES